MIPIKGPFEGGVLPNECFIVLLYVADIHDLTWMVVVAFEKRFHAKIGSVELVWCMNRKWTFLLIVRWGQLLFHIILAFVQIV